MWGHAIRRQPKNLERERYAPSGTVIKAAKCVDESRIFGIADTTLRTSDCGGRVWVENHT